MQPSAPAYMDLESPYTPKHEPQKPTTQHTVSAPVHATAKKNTHHKRNTCIMISSLVTIIILIIVLLLAILPSTIFKAKNPITTITDVSLENLDVSFEMLSLNLDLNITLFLTGFIHNPNKVSFTYSNSSLVLNYRNHQVGDAIVPAGYISARSTRPLKLNLTVMAERFLSEPGHVIKDLIVGAVPFNTFSRVSGKVAIMGFVKVHVESLSSCGFTVFVSNRTVGDHRCIYRTDF